MSPAAVGDLVFLPARLGPDHPAHALQAAIIGEPGRIVEIEDGHAMVDRGSWGQFGCPVEDLRPVERYCVESGRSVRMTPGDRCLAHGAAPSMCTTDVRPAQCEHPRLSPNHPEPTCEECGKRVAADA